MSIKCQRRNRYPQFLFSPCAFANRSRLPALWRLSSTRWAFSQMIINTRRRIALYHWFLGFKTPLDHDMCKTPRRFLNACHLQELLLCRPVSDYSASSFFGNPTINRGRKNPPHPSSTVNIVMFVFAPASCRSGPIASFLNSPALSGLKMRLGVGEPPESSPSCVGSLDSSEWTKSDSIS